MLWALSFLVLCKLPRSTDFEICALSLEKRFLSQMSGSWRLTLLSLSTLSSSHFPSTCRDLYEVKACITKRHFSKARQSTFLWRPLSDSHFAIAHSLHLIPAPLPRTMSFWPQRYLPALNLCSRHSKTILLLLLAQNSSLSAITEGDSFMPTTWTTELSDDTSLLSWRAGQKVLPFSFYSVYCESWKAVLHHTSIKWLHSSWFAKAACRCSKSFTSLQTSVNTF